MATKRPKTRLSDEEIDRRVAELMDKMRGRIHSGEAWLFTSPVVRHYDTDNPPPPDPPGTHRVSLKFLIDDERDAELEAYGD